jgi:hypothetical protein
MEDSLAAEWLLEMESSMVKARVKCLCDGTISLSYVDAWHGVGDIIKLRLRGTDGEFISYEILEFVE